MDWSTWAPAYIYWGRNWTAVSGGIDCTIAGNVWLVTDGSLDHNDQPTRYQTDLLEEQLSIDAATQPHVYF